MDRRRRGRESPSRREGLGQGILPAGVVTHAGADDVQVADAGLGAGYTEATALQIILAAAVKALPNCSNRLFQTVVDDKFAACKLA